MELEIRLADPDVDAAGVAEIYGASVAGSVASFEAIAPDTAEMGGRMRTTLRRTPWLVAVGDGQILGYAYAGIHSERAAYRWSVNVSAYIREGHRGRRIGRSLYDQLLAMLIQQGFANVYAGITLPNPASVALHQSIGMGLIGVYPRVGWKFGAWHDVGWYGLRLQEPQATADGEPHEPGPVPDGR
jgi:L-amino acid N-acyltransferase YncA